MGRDEGLTRGGIAIAGGAAAALCSALLVARLLMPPLQTRFFGVRVTTAVTLAAIVGGLAVVAAVALWRRAPARTKKITVQDLRRRAGYRTEPQKRGAPRSPHHPPTPARAPTEPHPEPTKPEATVVPTSEPHPPPPLPPPHLFSGSHRPPKSSGPH